MCNAIGWRDGRPQSLVDYIGSVVDEDCTPLAVDPASGKIVGFFCCHTCTRQTPLEVKPTQEELRSAFPDSPTFVKLINVACVPVHRGSPC